MKLFIMFIGFTCPKPTLLIVLILGRENGAPGSTGLMSRWFTSATWRVTSELL